MAKKPLSKSIKEMCVVEIVTSDQESDYKDVDLTIKFLDGTLRGIVYKLNIDVDSYNEVGW